MRFSVIPLSGAAAIAFALNAAAPNAANAESVMSACASQWKQAQAAGTTGGETWPEFLTQCKTRLGGASAPASTTTAPAPTPAPAPASQTGSLFPWWQPSAPTSAAPSAAGAPAAAGAGEFTTELQARAGCPSDTVVLVNTQTRVYHYPGTHYYGRTRKGAYMCEADARAAGDRAARNRERVAGSPSG
jgi:hypothetical protein